MPSGATEFRAAVGCWRDRRLHCKARRRHGGVRRSESRQTANPSANARAPWGRATTSDSRPAFPDESAALAGEVGATREAWVSCLVGRKANGPSSEDPPSRRGNLDARLPFGRSRVADSRDRAVRPARQRSPDDHTRDYDRGVGKGTHAGLPPATKVESGAAADGRGESKRIASALEEHRPEPSRKITTEFRVCFIYVRPARALEVPGEVGIPIQLG